MYFNDFCKRKENDYKEMTSFVFTIFQKQHDEDVTIRAQQRRHNKRDVCMARTKNDIVMKGRNPEELKE